jgi:hypothetical protein
MFCNNSRCDRKFSDFESVHCNRKYNNFGIFFVVKENAIIVQEFWLQ